MQTNLSTILRQKGLLAFSQEESLLEQVKASGISMPEALLSSGLFTSRELTEHLNSIFGLNQPELSQYEYASLCQQLGLRELIPGFPCGCRRRYRCGPRLRPWTVPTSAARRLRPGLPCPTALPHRAAGPRAGRVTEPE